MHIQKLLSTLLVVSFLFLGFEVLAQDEHEHTNKGSVDKITQTQDNNEIVVYLSFALKDLHSGLFLINPITDCKN